MGDLANLQSYIIRNFATPDKVKIWPKTTQQLPAQSHSYRGGGMGGTSPRYLNMILGGLRHDTDAVPGIALPLLCEEIRHGNELGSDKEKKEHAQEGTGPVQRMIWGFRNYPGRCPSVLTVTFPGWIQVFLAHYRAMTNPSTGAFMKSAPTTVPRLMSKR